jgi:hypothetical protein
MTSELRRSQRSFETLNQVGGGHDFDAEGADQFERPAIDARDVGDGAIWRIIHRYPFTAP